jgi:hypothetical protein
MSNAIASRFCTRCGKLNDHTHEPPTRDRADRPAFTSCCGTPTTGLSYVNPQHRADCPLRNESTPAQPTGAREWLSKRLHNNGDFITYADIEGDDWERLMDEFAAHQTAALQQQVERLREALEEIRDTPPLGEARLMVSRLQRMAEAALKAAREGK